MVEQLGAETADEDTGFWNSLNAREQAYVRTHSEVRDFAAKTFLFHYGEKADYVVVVVKGSVKVQIPAGDNRGSLLAFQGPGDVLGELAAIDHKPHSGDVIAATKVKALVIPTTAFRTLLENSPRAAMWVLVRVVARLREADRGLAELSLTDITARVAARLVELAERYGSQTPEGILITLTIKQDELAAWVGSTRERVNRVLNMFRELGWISTKGSAITVKELEELRSRTG